MRLINKKALEKLKRKNRGNRLLNKEIENLINDVESNNWFYVVLKNHDNKIEKAVNAIRIKYDK